MNPDFEWKKLSFVLEGKGLMQEEALELAQSKASSAYKKSLVSAFELFKSNLEQDQLLRRRYVQAAVGDESRARAAIVDSLEAGVLHLNIGCIVETDLMEKRFKKDTGPGRKCMALLGS